MKIKLFLITVSLIFNTVLIYSNEYNIAEKSSSSSLKLHRPLLRNEITEKEFQETVQVLTKKPKLSLANKQEDRSDNGLPSAQEMFKGLLSLDYKEPFNLLTLIRQDPTLSIFEDLSDEQKKNIINFIATHPRFFTEFFDTKNMKEPIKNLLILESKKNKFSLRNSSLTTPILSTSTAKNSSPKPIISEIQKISSPEVVEDKNRSQFKTFIIQQAIKYCTGK